MQLQTILAKKKAAVIDRWFDVVVDSYPTDTSRLLKSQQDPFANPVGQTTLGGLDAIFDLLASGQDLKSAATHLDPIIRIRAVQDFTPSRATGFIFGIKAIVREIVEKAAKKQQVEQRLQLQEALRRFEDNVDEIGLMGFDIFMRCKETLYNIKAQETRNSTYRAFKRAGLLVDEPEGRS